MEKKSTLSTYRKHKTEICEEVMYDNTFSSTLLFRARTNCLQLNWRKRFEGESDLCQLCQEGEVEDQEHFLKDCGGLRHVRNRHCVTEDVTLESMLLFGERRRGDVEQRKQHLLDMWKEREKILQNEQRN